MISSEAIALVLAGVSTVGFIIFFGTATIIPIVIEMTILRKDKSIMLLHHYPYRLLSRIRESWSIATLLITSLIFAIISLLSLLYLINNNQTLLKITIYLSIGASTIIVIYILYIILSAITFKEKEINIIIEYVNKDRIRR